MNLTPAGFWVALTILGILAVIVVTAEHLRDRWAEVGRMIDAAPGPDDDRCQIGDCHEPAWSIYDRHPSGWLYVCRGHDAMVQQWAGPRRVRSIEAPFDQEAS